MNQCFKIKHGTEYDKAVKQHFTLRPRWTNVIDKVGKLLGNEKITEMALVADALWINTGQLSNEENKKLFNKDGKLKSNSKKAKELLQKYKVIVQEEGLSDYRDIGVINFTYAIYHLQGEKRESFVTSDHDIYYKADFDLAARSKGLVLPITEIEYEEKYLEELKKKEADKIEN